MLQSKFRFESGDIYQKLQNAIAFQEDDSSYQVEVEALTAVLPNKIPLEQIIIKLGATWIPVAYYEEFCRDVLGLDVKIFYSALVHEWDVRLQENRFTGHPCNSPENYDWGWFCLEAHDYHRVSGFPAIGKSMSGGLFTLSLNQQLPSVKVQQFLNAPSEVDPDYTRQAIAKQNQLKKRFAAWCRESCERAEKLSEIYNAKLNRIVLPDWTGSGLHLRETLKFTGIATQWLSKLRNYQLDAIWRFSLEGGIIALQVGLGKTAIACAVIKLRQHYGTCTKALVVVQRSTLNQFYDTFLEMYPDAHILCLKPSDLNLDRRQNQLAKIAYLRFDAVIMAHDSFEAIPLSPETELNYLKEALRDIEAEMVNLYIEGQTELAVGKTRGNDVLKRLERERNRVRDRISKLDTEPRVEGLTWDHLGFDFILVDEIQKYKNNHVVSKLAKRVAGLSVKAAARSVDFDFKVKALRHKWMSEQGTELRASCSVSSTGGTPATLPRAFTGLVGMSGTPEPTNALTGVYVFQQYFQPLELVDRGIANFDAWIANFGEIKPCLEPKVDGSWRVTERLTDFINVAELANLWFAIVHYRRYEDVQEDFGALDKRPEPKYITINNQMSPWQIEKMQEIANRYSRLKNHDPCLIPVRDGEGYLLNPQGRLLRHPKTKELIRDFNLALSLDLPLDYRADNFLLLAGDSRKLIIAPQLIRSELPVEPSGKLFKLANCVWEIYQNTKCDRLTQLVFFDIGTPSGNAKFNIYQWLKDYWLEKNIPSQEIAFIQNYKSAKEKDILFQRLNEGQIRILIASSEAGGIGVNIQQRLKAIHHGDLCYRPDQLEQREGRGVRQGNINAEVEIYRYITQGSKGKHGADTVMLQFLQNKQVTRDRFFNADPNLRRLSEGDTGAELYMALKAESTGDERVVRYTEIEIELEEKAAEVSLAKAELMRINSNKEGSINRVKKAIALCLENQNKFEREKEIIEPFGDVISFCFESGELVVERKDAQTTNKLQSLYVDYRENLELKEMPAAEARKYVISRIQEEVFKLDYDLDPGHGQDLLEQHELGSFKGLTLFVIAYGNDSFVMWLEKYARHEIQFRKTPDLLLQQLENGLKEAFLQSDRNQEALKQHQQRLAQLTKKQTEIVDNLNQLESIVSNLERQRIELQEILEIDV
jgi:Helicase conserved C-terminal domain